MRFFPRALALLGVAAALLIGAVSAYAQNATWNVSYSVASAISLVNNTADFALGNIVPGSAANLPNDSLTIQSNDPNGVQLTVAAPTTVTESGSGSCSRSASASISLIPTPTSGGSGGSAGTVANPGGDLRQGDSPIVLTPSAQNVFVTVPTNTGTLTEIFGSINLGGALQVVTAPNSITTGAGAPPNSAGCSYVFGIHYELIAE